MRVVKNEGGNWSIIHKGVEVGSIEGEWRYGKPDKKLVYMGEVCLGEVDNQKQAMQIVKEAMENRNNRRREQ